MATIDKLKLGETATECSSFDAPAHGSAGGSAAANFGRADGQVVHNPFFDAAVANGIASDSPRFSAL